ncbi:MAG: nucleotidyltransferase domain-containing protein [Firmicutes bacterium]|nr:nucleotidyltransferase domain-containing protein [Bacillota bacterium]
MLTVSEIRSKIIDIAVKYQVKKLSIFGSYADGNADDQSDIDMLVEFSAPNVSLLMLSDLKEQMKLLFNKDVDLIHAPIHKDSIIKINNVVDIYEQ